MQRDETSEMFLWQVVSSVTWNTACRSPSLLFDVTNIMSRHRGRSHVTDEGEELISLEKEEEQSQWVTN